MSAYIVSHSCIDALVAFAQKHVTYGQWSDYTANQKGQVLLDENAVSVAFRYSEKVEAMPYIHRTYERTPLEVLAECRHYEYQASEREDWKRSAAFDLLNEIRTQAITLLPGFDEVPWGTPDNPARIRRNAA